MCSQEMLHKIEWSHHKQEIISEQQYLFDNSLECDCVLVSAEGTRFQAHQVVLSSSSEFFYKILCELSPCVDLPIIHVPDAKTCVLKSILRFVYTGETTIASEYLTSLLEFCNTLNIKGCVANGFTLNGSSQKSENDVNIGTGICESMKPYKKSSESWSSEEYLVETQDDYGNCEQDCTENNESDYLEEYLDDYEIKQEIGEDESDDERNESTEAEFIAFEIETQSEETEVISAKSNAHSPIEAKRPNRQGTRSTNSEIDKALNEVNNGKTIHRLSVEYNLPRSTLYHRFRNNENLKQNYRVERKSALDSAVRAVLHERLSLKTAADRYKIPKTAIWREVRKCENYQPSSKEITTERQCAQQEILSGKSLTSISTKYGKKWLILYFIIRKLFI